MIMIAYDCNPSAVRWGGTGASTPVLVREVSAWRFGDLLDLVPVTGCKNAEVKYIEIWIKYGEMVVSYNP